MIVELLFGVFSWESTEVLEVWRAEQGYEWTLEHALRMIAQFWKGFHTIMM